MANEFVAKEVKKLFEEVEGDQSKKAAMAAAWVCAHFKALNIKIYDVSQSSSLSDYYILASAENPTQARSLVEELIPHFKKENIYPLSQEGMNDAEWILLDLGDIILHVFQESAREIYTLDQLWAEYSTLEIPQSFFTGSGEEVEKQTETIDDEKSYF